MATFNGNSAGPSGVSFKVVLVYTLGNFQTSGDNKGKYKVTKKCYVNVTSGLSSVWSNYFTTSWSGDTYYKMSTAGTYAEKTTTLYLEPGKKTSSTISAGYTGGDGNKYESEVTGSFTAPDKEFTITFNPNGGTTSTTSKTVIYKDTYGTLPTPTRTGYTFNGWYTSSSGGTEITSSTTVSIVENQTLYAQWTAKTYSVIYNHNNGAGGNASDSATYDESYTVKDNVFKKEGYTFIGWNESTDGTGTDWTNRIGSSFNWNIDSNITLYAQWKENGLTVDYYSNYADYGTYQGDPLDVNKNSNVLVYSKTYLYDNSYENGLNNIQNSDSLYLSRTGYFSTGYWGTLSSGGTLIDEKESFETGQALAQAFGLSLENGNESVTLYAQWEPANVAYYNNNGTYLLCNTYGKVNGSWEPMLLYVKINDTWRRSVIDKQE